MQKRRIFVGYDTKHDEKLKDFFLRQAQRQDAPFEVVGHSQKMEEDQRNWAFKTNRAVQGCEVMVIMLGPYTHVSAGVRKEVEMARDEEIPIVQFIGYKGGKYKGVPGAVKAVPWNWEAVKQTLA